MGANLYTRFVSTTLFPLHETLKRHSTVSVRRDMEASQYWSAEALEAYRVARLRALLEHAGEHVPYYRELFGQTGFSPRKLDCIEDLQALPFLDKPIIRANMERLKSERAVGLSRFNTGGSSGEPLIFFIGKERVAHDVAAKWRATRWWGVDIGDPEIVVWGSPVELHSQDRLKQLRDWLLRTKLLPAFEMSAERIDRFIAEIRSFRPAMLFGYPSSLSLIARRARDCGIALDGLGVKVAFVTSERLYDDQRKDIESVFGCPVANGYGGRDAGFIAHQCPSGGMHITAEDIIVEIVDRNGNPLPPGNAGEIVITHLATRDFPFIRYRTGDVGVLSDKSCPCGRGLPLLEEIQGRTTDFVVARDGTVMHGLALIYVIRDVEGVKKFKIVQESLEKTFVSLMVEEGFRESDIGKIREGLVQRLGSGVQVEIEVVEDIPVEGSGKFRYVVSRVPIGSYSQGGTQAE